MITVTLTKKKYFIEAGLQFGVILHYYHDGAQKDTTLDR